MFSVLLTFLLHAANLNGSWTPIYQEFSGSPFPANLYKNQKLVLNDSTYTVTAESVDKGIFTISDEKMDLYGKEGVNAGKHFKAIFQVSNDTLKVCYNLKGDSYPTDFTTKGKPLHFLSIFVKDPTNKQ